MRLAWAAGIVGLVCLALVGCAATMLPAVQLDPTRGPAPPPDLLGVYEGDAPITTVAEWEARRAPLLRAAFAERVYGPYPPISTPARILARDAIAYDRLAGVATIEQWSVAVEDGVDPLRFNMVVVLPRGPAGPAPIIVMQNFCGNRAAFRGAPDAIAGPLNEVLWACDAAWMAPIIEIPFGRHISVPPYADILARGYGLAMFYAGDVVADTPDGARAGMARLYGEAAEQAGAVAVWAWLYSRALDVLVADPRADATRISLWGHSRNGKAALYAAANDPRVAAVIAHQSGRGGASLSTGAQGESIGKMMEDFPHWFAPAFAREPNDPAFDQHQLLALIAPRPVLLGNARRDAWSDPLSAWRAAEAADPAYRLHGITGFAQDDMRTPNGAARLEFFTRDGLHGVTAADWRMFLDFLDTQLAR